MDKAGLPTNNCPENFFLQRRIKCGEVENMTNVESGENVTAVGRCGATGVHVRATVVVQGARSNESHR
jgi:hypothetical protein